MAKSLIEVVQDSPGMGLGIPVKTKNPLSRTKTPPAEPPFGFTLFFSTGPPRCFALDAHQALSSSSQV